MIKIDHDAAAGGSNCRRCGSVGDMLFLVVAFPTSERAERAGAELVRNGFDAKIAGSDDEPTIVVRVPADSEPAVAEDHVRGLTRSFGGRYRGKASLTSEAEGGRVPKMVGLDPPRELTADERAYLDFMLTHPGSVSELRTQGESVSVISECDCGCRSIGLEPALSAPPAQPGKAAETFGRDDYFVLSNRGRSAQGNDVALILHVIEGRMVELEIWDAAERPSGKSRGEVPELATLRHG
jgi:hypothetical protein